jgi:hypothetical protein
MTEIELLSWARGPGLQIATAILSPVLSSEFLKY